MSLSSLLDVLFRVPRLRESSQLLTSVLHNSGVKLPKASNVFKSAHRSFF
jgi:hypothetical protein